MATFSQSTIERGSDMVQDFLCSACDDKKLEVSADYYCESCVKFYCQKCIHLHGQLFTNHASHGRTDMQQWPVSKKVEDFFLKCDVHKEENLAMFCKDHRQLCCNRCAFLNHRQCKTLMFLSELVKITSTDLKQLLVTMKTTLAELKELQDNQEAGIRRVQISFDEQLHTIQVTREKIIAVLNMLEKKTLNEMKDTLATIQAYLKSDVDQCATLRHELKQLGDALQDISYTSMQELSLIATLKCQDKIQQFKKYRRNCAQVKSSITFHPNSEIMQCLSKSSGLGRIEPSNHFLTVLRNQDQVIMIEGKSEYYVRKQGSPHRKLTCAIEDICVLPSGQVLVVDSQNNTINLLNQQYQIVRHRCVSNGPWGICQITPTEVAVTCGKEIQFIKVNNSQLVEDWKLPLQHKCRGIANLYGDLLVTSGTALYQYSLGGKLVIKLHKDESDQETVWSCAVSLTCDKLYLTNRSKDKLLTLAMDGSVLSTFMDPHLISPSGVHVTPAGLVLVCGSKSNTILQVDSKGSRKLATLATETDGIDCPWSVCYNSNTDSMIVGQMKNKILVYKVK
ncbi:hypothetical protein DPMN_078891 [Dreissena polymorpha]|uniref:B box-type domain-containing protein n=1 Tax=Dreissena polymorpha TaxID=45954 RepID=A0A9D3YN28_DREPO|nr:hypothetical protein DPMN_078891 [Dreissena polymorpha]